MSTAPPASVAALATPASTPTSAASTPGLSMLQLHLYFKTLEQSRSAAAPAVPVDAAPAPPVAPASPPSLSGYHGQQDAEGRACGHGIRISAQGDVEECGVFKEGTLESSGPVWRGHLPPSSPLLQHGRFMHAELIWPNGSFYYGGIDVQRRPQGHGRLFRADGAEVYRGQWEAGQQQGYGCLIRSDGARYDGMLVACRMEGQGRLAYADGGVYVGEFVADAPHGLGRFTLPAGRGVWEGQWARSRLHGRGVKWSGQGKLEEVGQYDSGILVTSGPIPVALLRYGIQAELDADGVITAHTALPLSLGPDGRITDRFGMPIRRGSVSPSIQSQACALYDRVPEHVLGGAERHLVNQLRHANNIWLKQLFWPTPNPFREQRGNHDARAWAELTRIAQMYPLDKYPEAKQFAPVPVPAPAPVVEATIVANRGIQG